MKAIIDKHCNIFGVELLFRVCRLPYRRVNVIRRCCASLTHAVLDLSRRNYAPFTFGRGKFTARTHFRPNSLAMPSV